MQKIQLEDVMPLSEYERERPAFRQRVIAHKKSRRVLLGPEMSLVFEDRLTVLNQVLEMVRAERITRTEAVAEEIAVYNELIPPDGSLLATLMIEVSDAAQRDVRQRDYMGLERCVHLELGAERSTATFDPKGLHEDRIGVVQFITFALGPTARASLLDPAVPARIVCTHPRYGYAVDLSESQRRALAEDLVEKTV
jgi:hypothetical protein